MRNRRTAVALLVVATSLIGCSGATYPGASALPGVTGVQSVPSRGYAERLLYSFRAGTDGGTPAGTLVADASGALYGTTAFGGGGSCFGGCGTVFKLSPSGSGYAETIIYGFRGSGAGDGSGPQNGVVLDARGDVFGTTEYGGASGNGTVFELSPVGSSYVETVIYAFAGGSDGSAPLAGLTLAPDGTLFGATLLGGGGSACASSGCGTVFALRKHGTGYAERVLHRFTGGTDGATPGSAPILGLGGTLYGTAATGGGNPSCGGAPIHPGCGVIYALQTGRHSSFRTLYAFLGAPNDAANAFAGLIVGRNATLYGIGQYGGTANSGAAFAFTHDGGRSAERMIHSFTGGNDGSYPLYAPALGPNGELFGTTQYGGGSRNAGIAFELVSRSHGAFGERILRRFDSAPRGLYPNSGLLIGAGGALYGVTMIGGTASDGAGTVFELQP